MSETTGFQPEQVYFADLPIGGTFHSPGRTITEADVVNFACLSGDFTSFHVDAEFAAHSDFGQRIAQGALVLAVSAGLMTRLPIFVAMQPSLVGMRSMTCDWPRPTFIGDTVHVEFSLLDAQPSLDGTAGWVTAGRVAINQNGDPCFDAKWRLRVATAPK